ncbi:MAG: BlaI/MecI/CopY family transcriptional regulator [Pseudobutyrivibrio sp.]|nr:BlaI/MecI/CopY family transcriptional regulator [Pseudobutyrivibrio sp.]
MRKLTKGEYKVMECLWNSEEEMNSNEIAEALLNDKFSKPSVYKAIQSLEKEGFLTISSLELIGKIYARNFVPAISRDDYLAFELKDKGANLASMKNIYVAMLGMEKKKDKEEREALINDLQEIINSIRKREK